MEGIGIAEHCCGAEKLYGWFIPTQQQLLKNCCDLEMIIRPCAYYKIGKLYGWVDLGRVYHNFCGVVDAVSGWSFSMMRGIRMGESYRVRWFYVFTGISIWETWLHYCQCSLVKLRAELGSQQSWLLRSSSCSCLKLRCHQEHLQTFFTAHWNPVHQGASTGQVSLSSWPPAHCRTNGVCSLTPLAMVSTEKGGSAGLFCWIMFSVIDLLPSQWFFWRLHML